MESESNVRAGSENGERKLMHTVSEIRSVYTPDLSPSDLCVSELTEFDLVFGGSGIHRILDQALPCQAGEVYIVPPHIPHAFFLTQRDETFSVKRIFFRMEEWFDGAVAEEGNPRYCFGVFGDGSTVSYAKLNAATRQKIFGLAEKTPAV